MSIKLKPEYKNLTYKDLSGKIVEMILGKKEIIYLAILNVDEHVISGEFYVDKDYDFMEMFSGKIFKTCTCAIMRSVRYKKACKLVEKIPDNYKKLK